ncbi:hypothetical protein PMM47T1_03469 [Pseudomonas sp. M47T1]|uniref:UPF0149 family protein n=1 Tax=Pseudomonas sp. M47T1 TaxID=1179778 RepID=UPI0002606E8B|nr:UPF0149 family protein [Pseudomonas sp. M47T1]EIK98291.1 hypothetical protein PMM47T1_03469 [Pseudomonas sp. M47T1]
MAYTISNDPLTAEQFHFIQDQLDAFAIESSVRTVSEMDGFFTAVVSYKDAIRFDAWYLSFWGGGDLPKWKSEHTYQTFFDALIQHMNQIALMLIDHPEQYHPLFNQTEDGQGLDCLDWCVGYLRGATTLVSGWSQMPEAPTAALNFIFSQLDADKSPANAPGDLPQALADAARELHTYWAEQRTDDEPADSLTVRIEQKIGRNDPCTCGSGKKYKQCCGR